MKTRHETEKEINVRAWKDPSFKKKLITNTHATLKEMGLKKLPDSVKIRIIEENKNEWCIVLHAPPANTQNLSSEELKNVSGGSCIGGLCCSD